MKTIIRLFFLIISIEIQAQVTEQLAMNTTPKHAETEMPKKVFSNSESADITFIVNSNLKENEISIETNYSGLYKIRIVDYYAGSRKVYKNMISNTKIDVSEFEKSIYIMNITDLRNKLLTSQVVNLKRRHL